MLQVILNGQGHEFVEGTTILEACRQFGVEVPTLCHDQRLEPTGGCRLCSVEIKGWDRFATACNTTLADGMEIQTHSAAVEQTRRTLLKLLAHDYPADAAAKFPEKPFHHWLHKYQVEPEAVPHEQVSDATLQPFRDNTHPYLEADLSKCITCFRCVRICDDLQGRFVWRAWNRGTETRIRPGTAATLLASDCDSCGACADTCPTGAIEDRSALEHGPATDWTRTTCPYCGVGCEMLVGTAGDRIVQVKPVVDSPVNKGHLCVKGRYAFGFTRAADRVTEPMIRDNGDWRKVSWTEAVSFVADRLALIAEHHGPDSIGVLGSSRGTNEENYLAQKFARVVLGTNNVDCCARVCHAPTATAMSAMLGTGAATNSFDDIERASTFLVCGCNPPENHPVVGARIKQAILRGAKLIVIDPRQTELARMADIHLALRPGTNVPLLNALACTIVEEGLFDAAAVEERTSEWAAFREFIGDFTPEKVAAICGVEAGLIRGAARLFAIARPGMCFHGLGLTEHTQGTDGVMCLVNLALLTGNFGKPGSGVNPLRGQNNVQGSAHMGCEPGHLTGYAPLDQGRDLFESVWQATLPRRPGLDLMQMMDAAAKQELKALWAVGYDIALTNPDATATRQALAKIDLVIVQDLFLNELAKGFGHVFLPACSSFERDGTFMNSERRVQRVRKALEPAGNSKPDWEIIRDVAQRMGFKAQFDFHSPEEIWNEVRTVWKAGAGIAYSRLEHGGLQWPCPTEDHPGTEILHTTSFPHGPRAPFKRVEFTPTLETATVDYPFLLTTGRSLYQFNAGTMTLRTPNAGLRPADTLDIATTDAARLGLHDGDRVRVRSRTGETTLPVRTTESVKAGELFATFHGADTFLNLLTSPYRDHLVQTPEYKVVAVNIERSAAPQSKHPGED
jgi:formate dehydrogenase major subunit